MRVLTFKITWLRQIWTSQGDSHKVRDSHLGFRPPQKLWRARGIGISVIDWQYP